MVIDSHIHVLSGIVDVNERINEINSNSEIKSVINVGMDVSTSRESVLISKQHSKFYSSVGIHPLYVPELLVKNDDVINDIDRDVKSLYELALNDKVVAIGEIGLDTKHSNSVIQELYFIRQIRLVNELELPVIIHSSNSNSRIVEIFETIVRPLYGCVFHCFQPDVDTLNYLVSKGYYISFAGRITYPNAKKSIEIAKIVPNNLFLVETDSPYILPDIEQVVSKLADVKGVENKDIETMTVENTLRLFKRMR